MRTYPIHDNNGTQWGFSLDMIIIGPRKISQLLSTVEGVSNIRRRKMFEFGTEFHIEFNYLGEEFVLWEPYGDSDHYEILPKNLEFDMQTDISALEAVFIHYKPPFILRILGMKIF